MADKHKSDRGLRDEAGVGPDPRDAVKLVAMRDLGDYKVSDGEPDIRGWSVFTATGRELGEVDDLLIDTERNEVMMVDIDLKRDDRHSLAPLKAAWIDRANRRVILNSQYLVDENDIPALKWRSVALEDESVRRFNEDYHRVYGEGETDAERNRELRIRRANDELPLRRPTIPPAVTERRADVVTEREVPREATPLVDRGTPPGSVPGRMVRYGRMHDAPRGPGGEPLVIEEVVTRRRVVDPAELSPEERARLRATGGVDAPPPPEDRR